jgi:hypothetical protein
VSAEELRAAFGEVHAALSDREVVATARGALERLLVPRSSRLFDKAVELQYTFPLSQPSPLTGTGVVPPAGFEPAIFTLKG